MNIPPELTVELYVVWHCGDGCCSDSQTLHYPAGQFETTAQLLNEAERDCWVYSDLYDDPDWLQVEGRDGQTIRFHYERPEREEPND